MLFRDRTILHNLYDSHVHWFYTGQIASVWNLKSVQNPSQLLQQKPQKGWVIGFGWDENLWPKDFKIHREFLDKAYPEIPVFLSRTDGHSSWVNTAALKKLGLWDLSSYHHDVELDKNGVPTGILRESAHIQSLMNLPQPTREEKKQFLLQGADIFNRAGFTHIREMTSNLEEWKLHQEIQDELLLHVEHWFVCENTTDFKRALGEAKEARLSENNRMKIRGIKIFVDGSLGSHTALLSHPYEGTESHGQLNWSEADIQFVLEESWKNQFEVAVHSLGDEAAHKVTQLARKIYSSGTMGRFHLEHTEILRPETIQALKSLHVRCHMQPCHWFSDSQWLESKLGKLADYAFPWGALSRAQIPLSFGSDSPIEKPSFFENLRALNESKRKKVPELKGPAIQFHQYPYKDSVPAETYIEEDRIVKIKFGETEKSF